MGKKLVKDSLFLLLVEVGMLFHKKVSIAMLRVDKFYSFFFIAE